MSAGNVLWSFRGQKASAVHSMRGHLPLRLPEDTRLGLVSTEAVMVKSPGSNNRRIVNVSDRLQYWIGAGISLGMVLLYLAFSSPRSDPGEGFEPGVVVPVEAGSRPDTGAEAASRETGPFDDQSTIGTNLKSDPGPGQQRVSLGKPNDSISAPVLAEKLNDSGSREIEEKSVEVPSTLPETSGD